MTWKEKIVWGFKILACLPVLGIMYALEKSDYGYEAECMFFFMGNLIILWVFIIACIVGLW